MAPKLTAVAHPHDADTFASRLEKCIRRSDKVKRIRAFAVQMGRLTAAP